MRAQLFFTDFVKFAFCLLKKLENPHIVLVAVGGTRVGRAAVTRGFPQSTICQCLFFPGTFCTQLHAVPVPMSSPRARENPSHGVRPWPRKSKGCSWHAAGNKRQLGGVGKDITDGRAISIDVACAGGGQAKQARRERRSSCRGQDGRPTESEGRGACCPRGGWCGAGAAPCEQTDKGGCFNAPPATNLDAKHSQVAASGMDELGVGFLFGLARGLEGSSCSAAAVVSWSPC